VSIHHLGATYLATLPASIGVPIMPYSLRGFDLQAGSPGIETASFINLLGTTDPINQGILMTAGSDLLYRSASGLEKAWADVGAFRLTATYAELVSDQWNPYRVSERNLPYLAWAMGINLWEDDWGIDFKRWWVANQWTLKYQRGSLLGTSNFVDAVGGKVLKAHRPPSKFYPGKSLTLAERAAFLARFQQLRIYPYTTPVQLLYLCFCCKFPKNPVTGVKPRNKNGNFYGPLRKFYTTDANAGSKYMRFARLYEPRTNTETDLTFRVVVGEDMGVSKVTIFDEVTLPSHKGDKWYLGWHGKAPLAQSFQRPGNKFAIFLGALGPDKGIIIRVPRDGSLDLTQFKAQYTTIVPQLHPINVNPNFVAQQHASDAKYKFYPSGKDQFIASKFLPPTKAGRYIYEQWYLWDPLRAPDNRKAGSYVGQAQFGIQNYTARLKINMDGKWPRWAMRCNGHINGFIKKGSTATLDKLRRAVTASMAARDTVHLDTQVKRIINTNDSLPLDGSFRIGQYIDVDFINA
jgi:phage tail P2-like protein